MQTHDEHERERVPTGIVGLDRVLAGGFLRGDIYLVTGGPGAGKTTLGNHVAFAHTRGAASVVYLTMLAETHGRMLAHLRRFRFFDMAQVGQRVHYLSVYDQLRDDGLSGMLSQARQLVRQHGATLLVVDGAGLFERTSGPELKLAEFLMAVQSQIGGLGCTTLLLSEQVGLASWPTPHLVDGIVALHDEAANMRQTRLLEVLKLRGSDYLRGRHTFAITDEGVTVYPRLESLVRVETLVGQRPSSAGEQHGRSRFGIPGLDEMLHGGLLSGSTTLLLGAPGAGKTTAGLHFLVEGARRGERGLISSFHETPERLLSYADGLGLDLRKHVAEGRVQLVWRPPLEVLLDDWGGELLAVVDAHHPKRLVVEALTDLQQVALFPQRLYEFLAALTTALRARGVTTLLSAEIPSVVGRPPEIPLPAASASIENVLLLRYVEWHSRLRRLVSVVKSRGSGSEAEIREFAITDQGMQMAGTFDSADAVLTGVARARGPGGESSLEEHP